MAPQAEGRGRLRRRHPMGPYSRDLRERVIAAVDAKEGTVLGQWKAVTLVAG
jgi:hypothetical protein